jgi:hypothetical protein
MRRKGPLNEAVLWVNSLRWRQRRMTRMRRMRRMRRRRRMRRSVAE